MNRLLVATRSVGKQAEFRSLLAPPRFDVVFPDDLGIPETAEEDQLEVHHTFEANARAKALWFARRSGITTLADDSGLEVDALAGAPGVWSKRFGGLSGSDQDVTKVNNEKLLSMLAGVANDQRTARYRCVLVLVRPDGSEVVVEGVTTGRIIREPRGRSGFGYDPLFYSDDLAMTFGEAEATAKHTVSHRARAVAALLLATSAP